MQMTSNIEANDGRKNWWTHEENKSLSTNDGKIWFCANDVFDAHTHMDQVSSKIIFCIIKLTKIWTYEINVLYHCSSNATKTSFVSNGRCISKQWYIHTIKEILVSLKSQTWNIKQIYSVNLPTEFEEKNYI